jgi:capsular exopolysaccharide synthesis family protein
VLIVDCDLRNPNLAKYFGVQNGRGLSEYIQGTGELRKLVKATGIERLRILPAGKAAVTPGDLIASKRMKALLNGLKSHTQTDFVIIDATPILATAEPEVLAALVDGIIIVVRAGATPRETVEQAMVSLEKKKILGAVLNDLVFKTPGLRSSYFGTNGYYYKYGYGNGNGQTTAKEDMRKIFRLERWKKKEVSGNGENPEPDVRKLFHHKPRRSTT